MLDLLVEPQLKKSEHTLKAKERLNSAYIPALNDGVLRTL